jgi:hypothetical protein
MFRAGGAVILIWLVMVRGVGLAVGVLVGVGVAVGVGVGVGVGVTNSERNMNGLVLSGTPIEARFGAFERRAKNGLASLGLEWPIAIGAVKAGLLLKPLSSLPD